MQRKLTHLREALAANDSSSNLPNISDLKVFILEKEPNSSIDQVLYISLACAGGSVVIFSSVFVAYLFYLRKQHLFLFRRESLNRYLANSL